MSIAEVASSKARGSDTDGTAVVTLSAAIQAGDTIVLTITERGAESATITGISDSVNGAWPAAVVGATDSAGSTARAWFYVFENSGAGTPAITITTSGAASIEATAVGLHGTVATPTLDVLGTTYNTAGAAEATPDTAAVSATAAGIIVAGINTNVYQGSAPTEGGGAAVGPASTADGRTFMATRAVSGAGSEDFAFTAGSSTRWIVFQATFIEDAGGPPPPSITDVDGDDSITLEQQNIATNVANEDSETIEIRQGLFTFTLSGNAASADMPDISVGGEGPKAGAADWAVINGDDQEDDIAITIEDETGTLSVDVGTPETDPEIPVIELSPAAEGGEQVRWWVDQDGFDETDFTLNDDLTYQFTEGLEGVWLQAWHDGEWSAPSLVPIGAAAGGGYGGNIVVFMRRRGRR